MRQNSKRERSRSAQSSRALRKMLAVNPKRAHPPIPPLRVRRNFAATRELKARALQVRARGLGPTCQIGSSWAAWSSPNQDTVCCACPTRRSGRSGRWATSRRNAWGRWASASATSRRAATGRPPLAQGRRGAAGWAECRQSGSIAPQRDGSPGTANRNVANGMQRKQRGARPARAAMR